MRRTSSSASSEPSEPSTQVRGATRRRAIVWALRILGTTAGFAYVIAIVDPQDVSDAVSRVSAVAFVAASLTTGVNLLVGAARWRMLLAAYGAPARPSILRLARVYLVGFFYNLCLPGGVGGDVVRGVVTRDSFGARGATASMTVVLVERVLGLSGLLLLVSGTYLVRPLPGTERVLPISALFLAGAALGVLALAAGRRAARFLPGKLAAIASSLPTIERPLPFVGALLVSLVTQTLVAVGGWFLMASITGGRVTLADALVVVPLAMAAVFFPFSVGGAGAREAAFVALGTSALGMSRADALASSLLLWVSQLAVASVGGVAQLVAPLGKEREER